MSVAGLFNAPRSLAERNYWTRDNANSHNLIILALQKAHPGIKLSNFVLDPLPDTDFASWLLRHQIVHNEMDSALHIGGNDYTGLDFQNSTQLEYLLRLHANEHIQAQTILRINA